MDSWEQDGQSEDGKIKFKNSQTGQIKWSSEHIDPQSTRPSPDSTFWLSDKYFIDGSTKKTNSFWIVSSGKTHGAIVGSYYTDKPNLLEVMYFVDRPLGEDSMAYVLDLALNMFNALNLDFTTFKLCLDAEHAGLGYVIETMHNEETASKLPCSHSIFERFSSISAEELRRHRPSIQTCLHDFDALKIELMRR